MKISMNEVFGLSCTADLAVPGINCGFANAIGFESVIYDR